MSLFPFARLLKGGRYKKEVEYRKREYLVLRFHCGKGRRPLVSVDEVRALIGRLPVLYQTDEGVFVHLDQLIEVDIGNEGGKEKKFIGGIGLKFSVREWIRFRPRKRPRRQRKGETHRQSGDVVVQFRRS